jgi:pimeloyl-ACP methyl ester carboxylesterase
MMSYAGSEMNIFEYGNRSGIPLVFFGGTPQKGDAFAGLDTLARETDIRLICPTRPWYDNQEVEPSFEAVSTPLLNYLRNCSISSVHVMGGSGGGPFAVNLAKVAPEIVATCTLLASMGMPEIFVKLVSSPPTLDVLKAFRLRDYQAWTEATRQWGLAADLSHGAWGDFIVYFDELPRQDLNVSTPVIVYQSTSDANAPIESVQEMLAQCPSVTWHISERADHVAMASGSGEEIVREIFQAIASDFR